MSRKTRKLMWSVPLIAAVAVIGALAAFMTLTPNDASADAHMPGPVKNLTVGPNDNGVPQEQLLISWDAPDTGGAVTSYRIDISEDGERWLSYRTDHGNSDLRVVYPTADAPGLDSADGLEALTMRHFRVFAFYDKSATERIFGPGTDEYGTTAASNVPDVPTNVAATDGITGSMIDSVDFNMDGDMVDTEVDGVVEAEFGLDLNGDGDLLDTVDDLNETTPPPHFQQTVIRVTWDAPEDPPGAPVTGYRVESSSNGTSWSVLAANASGSPFYHGGLLANTPKWYRVSAINSVGTGDRSDGDTGKTASSTAPGDISNPVIGLAPAASDVYLTWTPPAVTDNGPDGTAGNEDDRNIHGDPVTHYRIQARHADVDAVDRGVGPDGVDGNADDKDVAAIAEGEWKSLTDSKHISKRDAYHFTGVDLRRAGITVPSSIPADLAADDPVSGAVAHEFTNLVLVDIRIAAINRVNTDAADSDDSIEWAVLLNVPVGHEDAPLQPSQAPTVKADQEENQGRSGLNVTWPTPGFLADEGPPSFTVNNAKHYASPATGAGVFYYLFIDDDEYDFDATSADTNDPIPHSFVTVVADDGTTTPAAPTTASEVGTADDERFVDTNGVYRAAAMGGDFTKPGFDDDGLSTETSKSYHYQIVNPAITVAADTGGTGDADSIAASVRSLPSPAGSGTTEAPIRPSTPISFMVSPDGHTEVMLKWATPVRTLAANAEHPCDDTEPAANTVQYELDGSECGDSVITGYKIERSATGSNPWMEIATVEGTEYLDTGREPGKRYHYRVSTMNSRYTSTPTAPKSALTHPASNPTPPGGLVAQADGYDAIKLCWYEQNTADPSDPLAESLPILGYMITSVDADGDEMVLAMNTGSGNTEYTAENLDPNTAYTFRVRSITLGNIDKMGDARLETQHIEAMATTDPAMVSSMPTGLSASTVSDTQIDLDWMAPASDGGADVMSYIIERRYTGDMMGDIPSDGYNDAVGGRTFAFSNAMEWWETLNCTGMLAVVGSSETPAAEGETKSADEMKYCAHYLNTEPTNITDSAKELSDDAKMDVEALFAKRFVVTDDAMTMHMDTGLMPSTMYTYRVSAVNSAGRSAWSAAAMDTTDRSNAAPTVASAIGDQMVTAGMSVDVNVSANFSDPDGDMLTYTAMSSNMDAATVSVSGSTVTVMGVAAGSSTITVTATDTGNMAGMLSVSQMFDVTVASATTELGAPTGVTATVDDSDSQAVTVTITWGAADNADRYIAVLFDANFEFDTDHVATHQTDGSVTFMNVPPGEYTAVVISIKDDANGNAEDIDFGFDSVTVN